MTQTRYENTKPTSPNLKEYGHTAVIAKILRILALPPLMVLGSFLILHFKGGVFTDLTHCLLCILFLSGLPILAYPLSFFIPALRKTGRKGQRNLALVLSVIGYLCGVLYVFLLPSTPFEKILCCTYLFSGVVLSISTLCGFKSSGHAAGVAGPAFMLTYVLGPIWSLSFLVYAAVVWSSLKLGRHTVPQLIVGALIPIVGILLFGWIF